MHEVQQVGAHRGVGDRGAARLLDEPAAEHQAVALVSQLGRQRRRTRQGLERGLEQLGDRVADRAREPAECGDAEGHVVDDTVRRAAGLVGTNSTA